jgi:hypothetical protein
MRTRGSLADEKRPDVTAVSVDDRLFGIVAEGAVDRFCGRPREQNPYTKSVALEWWAAWEAGWDSAGVLLEERGQEETSRWLRA